MTMLADGLTASTVRYVAPSIEWIIDQSTITERDGSWIGGFGDERFESDSPVGLSRMIAAHLYSVCHAGITQVAATEFMPSLLEDPDFEGRLSDAAAHSTRLQNLPIVDELGAGAVLSLQGLRVYFPPERISDRTPGRATAILPSMASRLSLGFMFYTSQRGSGTVSRPLRIYRHVSSGADAVDVWARFTRWAEDNHLPVRAKIISRESGFPRNDALVIYLPSECWHRVADIAKLLATKHPAPGRSAFTQALAPGVAMAWEPHDPSGPRAQISFGEHRSAAVAKGIVEGNCDRERTPAIVRRHLLDANIDPLEPYKNLDSPVISELIDRNWSY